MAYRLKHVGREAAVPWNHQFGVARRFSDISPANV
jgi:hypothetical protein